MGFITSDVLRYSMQLPIFHLAPVIVVISLVVLIYNGYRRFFIPGHTISVNGQSQLINLKLKETLEIEKLKKH